MKLQVSPRALFVMGFVLLLASNAMVLAGVAFNRGGAPEAVISVTQRELRMPYRLHKENSGLALRLVWRCESRLKDATHYTRTGSPKWFDEKKLKELGFEVEKAAGQKPYPVRHREPVAREVFIVLENDGETFERALMSAETAVEKAQEALSADPSDKKLKGRLKSAMERLKRERARESRLFAVNAGLDAGLLRERYTDRSRFIIAKGRVESRYGYGKKKRSPAGHISRLSIERINVPLKFRRDLDSLPAVKKPGTGSSGAVSYSIELAYGSRFEPWIRSVQGCGE